MPVTTSDEYGTQELRSRLTRVRGSVQDVAASCLLAADELEATGSPPAESDIDFWESLDREIRSLTAALDEERGRLGLGDEGSRLVPGFDGLESALAEIEETRRRQIAVRKAIDSALVVADAAAALKHIDDAGFSPLQEARRAAETLRGKLADPDDPLGVADETWSDANPLCALCTLVANPDGLDDVRWTALQDVVAAEYGRALSTAVTRGRIVMDPDAAARYRDAAAVREGRM